MQIRLLSPFLLIVFLLPTQIDGSEKGGEKAIFIAQDELPSDLSYRQNVCHRWEKFRDSSTSSRALKDGLSGMQLNVVMGAYQDSYFNYDEQTGIDPLYPGLTAVIMDELAKRANFTWRNSFSIYKDAADHNTTWDELHLWATDTFDLTVDWWPITVDRMNEGVVFLKECAIVHMLLEYFANDRDNRSLWTWLSENFYMSFLNFSQIYEYNPTSSAGRFFGMSMSIWALVMTATYTANLASLLVDQRPPPPGPQSLAQAAVLGHRICIWEGTSIEDFLEDNFGDEAIVIPLKNQPDLYHGLYSGKCDYSIDSVASWNKFKAIRDHNPQCKLYWVGGEGKLITKSHAGFTTKADSGNLCSGFIRDVLNIHMHDVIDDGFLDLAWERDFRITQTIDCDTYQDGETLDSDTTTLDGGGCSNGHHEGNERRERRRLQGGQNLQPQRDRKNQFQRLLQSRVLTNSGDAGTPGGGESAQESERLTLNQMLGIFIVHWFFSGVALIIAGTKCFLKQFVKVRAPSFARTPGGKKFKASIARHQEEAHQHDLQDIKEQLATLQQMMEMQMQQQNQKMENMQQSKQRMQQQIQQQMHEHDQKMKQYEDLLLRWPSTSHVEERK